MIAEFVGGPRDGMLLEVEDAQRELEVVMQRPCRIEASYLPLPAYLDMDTGTYRREGDSQLFRWMGEKQR